MTERFAKMTTVLSISTIAAVIPITVPIVVLINSPEGAWLLVLELSCCTLCKVQNSIAPISVLHTTTSCLYSLVNGVYLLVQPDSNQTSTAFSKASFASTACSSVIHKKHRQWTPVFHHCGCSDLLQQAGILLKPQFLWSYIDLICVYVGVSILGTIISSTQNAMMFLHMITSVFLPVHCYFL